MTIPVFRFDVGNFLRLIIASICLPFIAALVLAQTPEADKQAAKAIPPRRQPLVHTYSIVARDPETGQLD